MKIIMWRINVIMCICGNNNNINVNNMCNGPINNNENNNNNAAEKRNEIMVVMALCNNGKRK
jgi:hypothetical protein